MRDRGVFKRRQVTMSDVYQIGSAELVLLLPGGFSSRRSARYEQPNVHARFPEEAFPLCAILSCAHRAGVPARGAIRARGLGTSARNVTVNVTVAETHSLVINCLCFLFIVGVFQRELGCAQASPQESE